jgi:hypothetical protein
MTPLRAVLGFSLGILGVAAATGTELGQLKVLYVGDAGSTRANQFESFLRQNVGKVTVAARQGFTPAQAESFDVVLLDWPQPAEEDWKAGRSPLGPRGQWNKPTVLLGSAGLNLAVVWKVRGGSG